MMRLVLLGLLLARESTSFLAIPSHRARRTVAMSAQQQQPQQPQQPDDTTTTVSRCRQVTREELYEKVWSTPISHLAAEYGVSGSYLARVCTSLAVPRPPAGYWQKKAVGKDAPRLPLPPAKPGDQLVWSADGEGLHAAVGSHVYSVAASATALKCRGDPPDLQ